MPRKRSGLHSSFKDVWLVDGARTAFADLAGVLNDVSPTDLGIKVAREAIARAKVPAEEVGIVVAGNVAQTSFDAFMLPRHIGLYAGVPIETPAELVQRICGTGVETIIRAADAIDHDKADLGLCVGAESMSRNPIAAYTHRKGFRMGQVEFKDFLWEALLDPAPGIMMGHTAENVAKHYQITREDVDVFAAESFERALKAQKSGFHAGEIAPLSDETFELKGYNPRGIKLPRGAENFATDTHVRPSPIEALRKIKPAFGGVQTGGNSSGIVDGAAAAVVASGSYVKERKLNPLARLVAGVAVGVPPEVMSIGPAPAIRALLEATGMKLDAIDRFEINEAFGAQVLAVQRELGIDRSKLNVNGGAIAIGHPLGATGVRLAVTLARELRQSNLRWGIASACIGGGQGIALLVENTEAAGRA